MAYLCNIDPDKYSCAEREFWHESNGVCEECKVWCPVHEIMCNVKCPGCHNELRPPSEKSTMPPKAANRISENRTLDPATIMTCVLSGLLLLCLAIGGGLLCRRKKKKKRKHTVIENGNAPHVHEWNHREAGRDVPDRNSSIYDSPNHPDTSNESSPCLSLSLYNTTIPVRETIHTQGDRGLREPLIVSSTANGNEISPPIPPRHPPSRGSLGDSGHPSSRGYLGDPGPSNAVTCQVEVVKTEEAEALTSIKNVVDSRNNTETAINSAGTSRNIPETAINSAGTSRNITETTINDAVTSRNETETGINDAGAIRNETETDSTVDAIDLSTAAQNAEHEEAVYVPSNNPRANFSPESDGYRRFADLSYASVPVNAVVPSATQSASAVPPAPPSGSVVPPATQSGSAVDIDHIYRLHPGSETADPAPSVPVSAGPPLSPGPRFLPGAPFLSGHTLSEEQTPTVVADNDQTMSDLTDGILPER